MIPDLRTALFEADIPKSLLSSMTNPALHVVYLAIWSDPGHLIIIIERVMKHSDVKAERWMAHPGVRTRLYNCRLRARSS